MKQTLSEPEQVKLALREIAEARDRLQRASDALSRIGASAVSGERPPAAVAETRLLELEKPPRDLLDIAQVIIEQVLPRQLARKANQAGASPRAWLYRVHTVSIVPRGIAEPVTRIAVMLAAVKFGLRHQLLLQTETRLGLAHKSPIAQLDHFLETFISEVIEADPSDARFNAWLKRTVISQYPDFRGKKGLELPNGNYLLVPEKIEPIRQQAAAPVAKSALTSPLDPASGLVIPRGSGWSITLGFAQILYDQAYPAFHGKHHSGIDIYRWNAYQAPVYAMRPGVVIDSVYLPKGFGNTVVIEHDDGSCLRYTHLDKKLINQGDRVERGQRIGTVGKGEKNIYPAHLHLDMPRSRQQARARTYYDRAADVAERFIDPLSQIAAAM